MYLKWEDYVCYRILEWIMESSWICYKIWWCCHCPNLGYLRIQGRFNTHFWSFTPLNNFFKCFWIVERHLNLTDNSFSWKCAGWTLIKFKTSAVISPTRRHLLPLCFSLCGSRVGWFRCPGGLCGAAQFTQDAWLQFSLRESVTVNAKSENKDRKAEYYSTIRKRSILRKSRAIDLEPFSCHWSWANL